MNQRSLSYAMAIAAGLMAAASPIARGAEGLATLSVGADYSTGKYGASERTDTLYIPTYAKYETGAWHVVASGGKAATKAFATAKGKVTAAPYSATILYR